MRENLIIQHINDDLGSVTMMWDKCISTELDGYICLKDNYIALNQLNITFHKVSQFVKSFIERVWNSQDCYKIILKIIV